MDTRHLLLLLLLLVSAAAQSCRQNTTDECRDVGGHCFREGRPRECDFMNATLCDDGCDCCIRCRRQDSTECESQYAGQCNVTCGEDYLTLDGCEQGCQCCGCKILDFCKEVDGYCVTNESLCDGTVAPSGCEGSNCSCCIPDPPPEPCVDTDNCTAMNGTCNTTCGANETAHCGLCDNSNCFCCVPEEVVCPQCKLCNNYLGGTCQASCDGSDEQDAPSVCPGDDCTCCTSVPPNNRFKCRLLGGNCSPRCSNSFGYCFSFFPFFTFKCCFD